MPLAMIPALLPCVAWPAGRARLPHYGPETKEVNSTELCDLELNRDWPDALTGGPGRRDLFRPEKNSRAGLCVCVHAHMCEFSV